MVAELLDGRAVAQGIRREVAEAAAELANAGTPPGLAAVLVGDAPASRLYVRMKEKAAEEAGFRSVTRRLPDTTTEAALLKEVEALNADPGIHGILVQLPLPDHIDEDAVLRAVDPAKDVDGFHPENMGRILAGNPRYLPATVAGIVELLSRTGHDPAGKDVVVLGRSNIVGKPLAAYLLNKAAKGDAERDLVLSGGPHRRGGDATVTVCHTRSADLADHARRADILVAAVGRAGFVTADMVKPGAVVIDVGTNRIEDPTHPKGSRVVGDVDFDAVKDVAGAITPVPGGVGPMTIAMLLANTLRSAREHAR